MAKIIGMTTNMHAVKKWNKQQDWRDKKANETAGKKLLSKIQDANRLTQSLGAKLIQAAIPKTSVATDVDRIVDSIFSH